MCGGPLQTQNGSERSRQQYIKVQEGYYVLQDVLAGKWVLPGTLSAADNMSFFKSVASPLFGGTVLMLKPFCKYQPVSDLNFISMTQNED